MLIVLRALAARVISALLVLLGVTLLTFSLTLLLPGDPAVTVAGPKASPEVLQRIRRDLGLDQPFIVQYGRYLSRLMRGDLGRSYVNQEPVLSAVLERLPATSFLAIAAWSIGAALGIALGCIPILFPRTAQWAFGVTVLGLSVPAFWAGLLLLYVFAFRWPLFPLGGFGLRGVVLPACALGLGLAANYARVTMARLADVMKQPFIQAARAKGVPRQRIVLRHAMGHVLLTLLTLVGLDLAALLGGVTLTETVFNWPGLGRLAVEAVFNQDIPVLMGTVLLATTFVVCVNFLVDACYAWLDPRVRREG
ncbi:MAG: ABC transporter permease [Candidatus Binatia bacterium]|nr:ABC transporter permease [Candidatus Binatia bacterium]